MDKKRCICLNQDPTVLIGAYAARAKKRIAAGLMEGNPPPSYRDLRMTVTLIRALSQGRENAPFLARHAHLDHHLPECPCSPSYEAPSGAAPAS